jgi:hypothetical protein
VRASARPTCARRRLSSGALLRDVLVRVGGARRRQLFDAGARRALRVLAMANMATCHAALRSTSAARCLGGGKGDIGRRDQPGQSLGPHQSRQLQGVNLRGVSLRGRQPQQRPISRAPTPSGVQAAGRAPHQHDRICARNRENFGKESAQHLFENYNESDTFHVFRLQFVPLPHAISESRTHSDAGASRRADDALRLRDRSARLRRRRRRRCRRPTPPTPP